MNLASNRNRISSTSIFASMDRLEDLDSLSELVHRYNQAHAHLNDVELALHDSNDAGQRAELMHNLEDARGSYMDARFALTRTVRA